MYEQTLIAKRLHFEFSTPRKTLPFRNVFDVDTDEVEPPNAPKLSKITRSRLSRKRLAEISVALFASDGEENWP